MERSNILPTGGGVGALRRLCSQASPQTPAANRLVAGYELDDQVFVDVMTVVSEETHLFSIPRIKQLRSTQEVLAACTV